MERPIFGILRYVDFDPFVVIAVCVFTVNLHMIWQNNGQAKSLKIVCHT